MSAEINKILISDAIDQKCIDILKAAGISVDVNTKLSKDELLKQIQNYDGLIIRSATKVTADVIAAASNLKLIGRAGTGVDNVDCKAASDRGIIVMNTPGGNTVSVAEMTAALVVCMARKLPQAHACLSREVWDKKSFMGDEVMGKTLAIVGLGRIGIETAKRMQAFGMTTVGYDPIVPAEVAEAEGVKFLQLEEIWPIADYITLHVPLVPSTKDMINTDILNKCKKGVRILNCARGGVIDEDALLMALESGQCGGAAIDSFATEPLKDFTLVKHPNVIGLPHLGASTREAQTRVAVDIAQQIVDFRGGIRLFGAVNAPHLGEALKPDGQPYVSLGTALGAVMSLFNSSLTALSITCYGDCVKNVCGFISPPVIVGYLKQSGVNVNLINANNKAKEAGLQIKVENKECCQQHGQIKLEFVSASGKMCVLSGTVSSSGPMLSMLDGCKLVSSLSDNIVVLMCNTQELLNMIGLLSSGNGQVLSYTSTQAAGAGDRTLCVLRTTHRVGTVRELLRDAGPLFIGTVDLY